jgi:hypothetical protein
LDFCEISNQTLACLKFVLKLETGMVSKVAILGSFDRFNYGDLLFPVIIENLLRLCNCSVAADFYSTRRSDLSRYGAKKTKSMRGLFNRREMPQDSVAILAGGEVLAEDWTAALDTVLPNLLAMVLGFFGNRCGRSFSNALCRSVLRVPLEFPWIVAPCDFPNGVKVAYNSVGGTGLMTLPPATRKRIQEKLRQATFLSVRDNQTKCILESSAHKKNVRLAPDSAILLSYFYPSQVLQNRTSPEAQRTVDRLPDGYICFQINKRLGTPGAEVLARELEKVYQRHCLAAVLLPIGTARHHEDQVALSQIKDLLRTPSVFIAPSPQRARPS